MVDWKQVDKELVSMHDYFVGCAANAAPGSVARKKFTGYMETLFKVSQLIREMLEEEDDGK